MNWLNFLLEAAAAAAESFAAVCAVTRMTGQRYQGKRQALLTALSVLCGTLLAVALDRRSVYRISGFDLLSLALPPCLTLLCTWFTSRKKLPYRAVATVLAWAAVYLVHCMTFSVTGALLPDRLAVYSRFSVLMIPGYARRIYLLLTTGLLLAAYFCLRRSLSKVQRVRVRTLLLPALGEVLLLALCAWLVSTGFHRFWMVPAVALSVCGTVALAVFLAVFLYFRKQRRTNELLHASNAMMAENYRQLYSNQQLHARQLHDFNHHIAALRGLALQGKDEEIVAYADSLMETSYREKDLCRSGNDVVDAILNRKTAEAAEAGIDFRYDVTCAVPEEILPADLCAVLANQIDNAFEACALLPEERRHTEVHIWQQTGEMVFFQVTNSTAGDPFNEDGELISTKRDRSRPHGLGVRSIRDTAEKYRGALQNSYEDGRFTSTAFLCVEPKTP